MITMLEKVVKFFSGPLSYVSGRNPIELTLKTYRLLRREGLSGFKRIYLDIQGIGFSDWIRLHDTLSAEDRCAIRRHIEALDYRPVISVLIPLYNPPPYLLQRAIDSVRNQLYPDWELCIADDASSSPEIRQILERASIADTRIRTLFRPQNGHVSATTNSSLAMAEGEFIAFLEHDDELTEHALYHVAVALNENRELDLLYSDEDKIDIAGHRHGHYFKPDWNPDLCLAQNLICHLSVFRRSLAVSLGGFREGYEGSQDWDFALRFVEHIPSVRIHHIPHILYHCRALPGAVDASIDAKYYAADAEQRTLVDYWLRRGINASVTTIESGLLMTRLPLPPTSPLVSIIICTRNREELIRQCIDAIGATNTYSNIELIVVDNGSDDDACLHYLSELQSSGKARIIRHEAPFNFSALNNLAARQAQGSLLCLLNNDVAPICPDWLTEMVAHALRPEIGAVGAKLYFPDGKIQHAGVILNGTAASHLHLGYPRDTDGYGNRAKLTQNFSAVTAACMVIRKAIWDEVGGMDETFAVAFNDVDFCLRVRNRGYRNLWLPQAELYHYESASRGKEDTPEKRARFLAEINLLQQRWGKLLREDPAWNPNLSLNGARIVLATPPRTANPWATFNDHPV